MEGEDRGMVRFLTAGSVDDGKSTLIGRLLYDTQMIYEDQLAAMRRDTARRSHGSAEVDLSLLTDGLRAEREQGITIDVAHRYFSTARRKFIIADCPGHEQYTRNMATGASNCDLAIVLIDAGKGVLPQTKRHSFIVSLLGIKHVVVAINKMDLVGYSEAVFDRIVRDYTGFASRLEIPDLRFIPVSALRGDNVVAPSQQMPWYAGETLLHYLEHVHIASDRNLIDMRFPVQYVNRPHAQFRGFCGTVASGIVRKGDEVVVLPSGARTRIKAVVTADGERDEAFPPMAITLRLADEIDVSRGDMIVHPGNLSRLDDTFEAMVVWMDEQPMVVGRPYVVRQTTSAVSGHVAAVRYRVDVNSLGREPGRALSMNEVGRCTIRLTRRVSFDPYAANRSTGSFILVDRSTNHTVAAGMIVDRATSLRSPEDPWDQIPQAAGRPSDSQVAPGERERRFGHRAATVLLTGPPGAGKRALAYALERRLFDRGAAVCVIDGRDLRPAAGHDTAAALSADEQSEHLRRAVEMAGLANAAGLICVVALETPDVAGRQRARAAIGPERYVEVWVSGPEAVGSPDDPNGGLSGGPSGVDLIVAGGGDSPEGTLARIVALLEAREILTPDR